MKPALARVKCRCGHKEYLSVAPPHWFCDTCLCTKGATDPFRVVGFWHGCLGTPDFNVQERTYWDGYAAALRSVRGQRWSELVTQVTRDFPDIDADKAVRAYFSQEHSASGRGIGWEFDLHSWVKLWLDSGKWGERGQGGYVMARKGDVGPYSPENVYITTSSQNIKDAWINKPSAARKKRQAVAASIRDRTVGWGRGWRYRPKSSAVNPYEVKCGRLYLGMFPTQEAAEAAYREAAKILNAERAERLALNVPQSSAKTN